ncbi:MAG: tetratricopeptide repeat protein, partial [Gemmataceae bacterium]
AALGIDDGNAEAYLRRGNAHAGKGQYEAAIADYNTAIDLAPDLGLAYVNRSLAFAKLGEFDRVIEDADRAFQLDPRLAGALFIRGAAYFKQGRTELAIADFDMLLLLEPKHVLAYNERGLVRASRGEYDLAIADYSRALRLDPQFELALFNRAIAYRLRGEHDKAIAEFSDLIARAPANAPMHYQRGLAYFDHKDYDLAIADLRRAFRIDPKCKEAYSSCLEVLRAKHENQRPTGVESPEEKAAPILPDGEITLQGETPRAEASAAPKSDVPRSAANRVDEAKSAPPERPRRVETPSPAVVETKAAEVPAETAQETPRSVVNVGKLRLECPTCGTLGLLDVRNLKKAFRCPGCAYWWRTDAAGRLVAATPQEEAGVEVEVWSNTGERGKHRVPSEAKIPAGSKPAPPEKPSPRKKPHARTRPRPSSEGRLRYAGNWIAAVSATRGGRWALGVAAVLLVASVGLAVSPLLWPGQLTSRGHAIVRAWLAKDLAKMEQYTDPADKPFLKSWLEKHPPPDLVGQEPSPDVRVSIEGNNGRTAVVVVQIAAKDNKGQPAHYVFRHRWLEHGGDWYFHPQQAKAAR